MSFAHLTIATEDVQATSLFFQNVMKWNPLRMPRNIDIEAVWLEICEGQQLHILGIKDSNRPGDKEFGRHYAFFHPSDDFDAVIKRVTRHGGELVEPIRETPFRRIFFRDLNGYLFELIDQQGYQEENWIWFCMHPSMLVGDHLWDSLSDLFTVNPARSTA